jgi:hypothetical protein
MSDTQAALKAAWERFNARNMFVHNCGLFESYENMRAVRLAQVACWKAGECCGEQGEGGKCNARSVQMERALTLVEAGLSPVAAGELSKYCEHCPQFADAASVFEFGENDQGQALAGRLWAMRFIQYYGDESNGNGISESGQGEASQGTGDNDGEREGDDAGTHPCGSRAN